MEQVGRFKTLQSRRAADRPRLLSSGVHPCRSPLSTQKAEIRSTANSACEISIFHFRFRTGGEWCSKSSFSFLDHFAIQYWCRLSAWQPTGVLASRRKQLGTKRWLLSTQSQEGSPLGPSSGGPPPFSPSPRRLDSSLEREPATCVQAGVLAVRSCS